MNELNKLYVAMWKSWNGVLKDDGRMMLEMEGQEYPVKIDDMQVYMPLSEILENNTMDKVFFHPACENITSKETEIFKVIRKITALTLLSKFRQYPTVLLDLANRKTKKTWNQSILNILDPLEGVKKSVRDELANLFVRMHIEIEKEGVDNRFIHFKVTKGGGRSKITGERVYYKTKPQFPFYNELVRKLARSEGMSDNQTVEVNNFSVSRAALKVAIHLFQVILPAVMTPDDFEFEATNVVAARLTSYLACYAEIADQLNRMQNNFRADFDKAGVYPLEVSWVEHLENFPDIWRQVPVMDYNSHNTTEESQVVSQGNLTDMLSFSSQQTVRNNNNQGNDNSNNNQNSAQQQLASAAGFDTHPPQMQPGDDYQNFEIDYNTNSVVHYAKNRMSGQLVMYRCSRRGNLIERREVYPQNNMGMGMMGNMNMGMMNPQMMNMYGMMPQQNMYGMMTPTMMTPTAGTMMSSIQANSVDAGAVTF